jgi:hypothetical protein
MLLSGDLGPYRINAIVYDEQDKELINWKGLPSMRMNTSYSTHYVMKANWTLQSRGNDPKKLLICFPSNTKATQDGGLLYGERVTNDLQFDGNVFEYARYVISFSGRARRLSFNFQPFSLTVLQSYHIYCYAICESSAVPFGWLL